MLILFIHRLFIIFLMGNKIGFQADNEKVKIAYVEEQIEHIKFIQSLKSKYLRSQIKWSNSIIFLFECTISEFISYHTTQNVLLLRSQYHTLLNAEQLIIRTNRATMNILKQNKQLQIALQDILMKQFKLQHTQRIENLVTAMHILTTNFHEFYKFKNCFSIVQLHNFNKSFVEEKQYIKNLPQKFILVVLRNGVTAYRIESGKKTERIDGSIIGEKTILSILKYKYPTYTTQQCFDLAFSQGNLKEVDLMVEDIYGKNVQSLGLPGDIVASSMAKISKMKPDQLKKLQPADVIRSIITSFAINSANLTALYLQKTDLHDAIILADSFHNNRFHSLYQSICASFAPDKSIHFANHAPFMACLGTAFSNCQNQQ